MKEPSINPSRTCLMGLMCGIILPQNDQQTMTSLFITFLYNQHDCIITLLDGECQTLIAKDFFCRLGSEHYCISTHWQCTSWAQEQLHIASRWHLQLFKLTWHSFFRSVPDVSVILPSRILVWHLKATSFWNVWVSRLFQLFIGFRSLESILIFFLRSDPFGRRLVGPGLDN